MKVLFWVWTTALCSAVVSGLQSTRRLQAPSPHSEVENGEEEQQQQEELTEIMLLGGNRIPGLIYDETFSMDMTTSIDIMGQSMEMKTHLELTSTTQATALPGAAPHTGQQVTVNIESVVSSTDMGDLGSMECDTLVTPMEEADEMCQPFYEIVTQVDFQLDEKGNFVPPVGKDEEPIHQKLQESQAAEQFKTQSRLLTFIPTHPIKQGDSWTSSEDLDGLGYFEGEISFLGMDQTESSSCAIISAVGTLDIDMGAAMEKFNVGNGGMAGSPQDITVTDSLISAKMCWDNQAKMAAWSEMELSMTMEMNNPIDAMADPLKMPIREMIKTTCKVHQ